jgi:hypothetical protein
MSVVPRGLPELPSDFQWGEFLAAFLHTKPQTWNFSINASNKVICIKIGRHIDQVIEKLYYNFLHKNYDLQY